MGRKSTSIDKNLSNSNKKLNKGKKYYRLLALAILVVSCSVACLAFLVYNMFFEDYLDETSTPISNIFWLIPNIYFLIQTIIFYKMRLIHMSLKDIPFEATNEKVNDLIMSKEQPYIVSVIPAYMEEPALLKRTLYGLCLQDYHNMMVVLLLGNDVYSKDQNVIANTKAVRKIVLEMKLEIRKQRQSIKRVLNYINDLTPKMQLYELGKLYSHIASWYSLKAVDIKNEDKHYPNEDFLINNTFIAKRDYFKNKANMCEMLANEKIHNSGNFEFNLSNAHEIIKKCLIELNNIFKISPSVFMRTKYDNLEQEKTKAGNLTAFSSLLGGVWSVKKNNNGRKLLLPDEKGIKIKEPKYFASFDSDTIVKPCYCVRKIAYMERKENSDVGLIQSPYVVPSPEPTPTASASGIQSYWFIPISVGLSALNSAFWLGFNGVFRFDAVKKMGSFITDTIIEDTQNSIKLKNLGYKVVTSPEENCMTFSPQDLKSLKIQRIRWSCGGFKIAKDLIFSMVRGTSGIKGFWQRFLAFNYVLGLNFLSIMMTSLYFLESPFKYRFYFFEALPFFLYLVSYVALLSSLAKYKFKNLVDGLAVSFFMNIYYLIGTVKSFVNLFDSEKNKVFMSTPRSKHDTSQIGYFEIFAISFILLWFWYRMVYQFAAHAYYDIFPIYQIMLILYGVERFHGWGKIAASINDFRKKGIINVLKNIKSNISVAINNSRFRNPIKFSMAFVLVFVIGFSTVAIGAERQKIKKHEADFNNYKTIFDENATPDAFEQLKRLGKGINLTGLDAPSEGDWGVTIKDEYFKTIREAGFDTIRLPVRWSDHASRFGSNKIDESFFRRIDRILIQAKKNNLNIVIDMHNYLELYVYPDKHKKRFINMWKQIASRYKEWDGSLYYEILNEPTQFLTPDKWNVLLKEAIKTIREIDSFHTIIVDAPLWGYSRGLDELDLPQEERNLIASSIHTHHHFLHIKEFYLLMMTLNTSKTLNGRDLPIRNWKYLIN